MKDDKILRAISNIDEDLIDRAAPMDYRFIKDKAAQITFALRLRWAVPTAACLIIAAAIAVPLMLKQQLKFRNRYMPAEYNDVSEATSPSPSLSLDNEIEYAACYAALDDWRGLPTENYILDEKTGSTPANRRVPFTTLDDLAASADMFVLIPRIHKTSEDGNNMQTSIAEYAETIGDRLNTRQWDDKTVSTGSRVLIRQRLIGGCTMDEPSNLLREDGVYLLPIKFNSDWSAYEVVGDFDVLFELNDEGKIVSHSQWDDFNKYDGKSLTKLIDDVRALYPAIDVEFIEQPISTAEQAENQVITAYNTSGFRKFTVEYDSEAVIKGADVYLFLVSFDGKLLEYAAISKKNGAFIRGELKSNGDMQVLGGLGDFPKNSR